MNKRKIALIILLLFCIIFESETIIYAEKVNYVSYENDNNDIYGDKLPKEVTLYFNNVYNEAIEVAIYAEMIDTNINISDTIVGKGFVIYDEETEDSNIWYFPIYYNNEIVTIVKVLYLNNELTYQISNEFVEQLNELEYNVTDILFKFNEKIYCIKENNFTYCISYGRTEKVNTFKTYNEIEYYISNQYITPVLKVNHLNDNSNYAITYNAVKNITGGKQCIMSDCFVKQYNYGICWAACVATIVKYSDSAYVNMGLNAFDVAMYYAYENDLSTNPNDEPNAFQGASVYDAQYMLALYGVYYSVLSRKLSYNEIKDEIDHGYPIYMSSAYYNENKVRSGHATVLYGYYALLGKKFFKIWNPGSGSEELAYYNSSGDICYTYNGVNYVWENSICKATYVFK